MFHFSDNGHLRIERNGIKIGSGYCFTHIGSNKWCDYRVEAEQGSVHVNMYYDAAQSKVYRMGDGIQLSGVMIWQDNASLQVN